MQTCALGNHCWIGGFFLALGWWLVASGLLFLSWNKVICSFAKLKPAKYWQALLLVATVCVFCAPCAYRQRRMGHWGSCGHHSCCHHGNGAKDGECPYSHDGDGDSDDDKPASDAKQKK